MRSYQYAPLDRKSDTIRLLRLLPSEVDKAEIRAGLLEYDLRHSQQSRHSYEALSYVWGGMETTESVLIGDEELGITPNLHAALLRLRDATFPRMLWVDAVCINQSDIPEKEIQIQSMAKIYGYAKCTIVWLGEEADGSDTALEALRLAGSLPVPDFSDGGARNYDKGIDKPVASLLQRDWFQRIWVLQEVAAARHVTIVCGSAEIDGHAFCLGLERMQTERKDTKSYARASAVATLIQGAIFRPKLVLDTSGKAIMDICSLGDLINMYSAHSATHLHDRIYALLGMTTDDLSNAGLSPNYSVSCPELLHRLATFFLGKKISVGVGKSEEDLEITGKGCIIGNIATAFRDKNGDQLISLNYNKDLIPRRRVMDTFHDSVRYHIEVILDARAIAEDIWPGDIVYLVGGAAKPSILRSTGLFFRVIAIAATLPNFTHDAIFIHCLTIVWSWTKQHGIREPHSKHFPYYLHESKSYWTSALIMNNTNDPSATEVLFRLARLYVMPPPEREKILATSGKLRSGVTEPTQSELSHIVRCFDGDYIVRFFEIMGHSISIREQKFGVNATNDTLLAALNQLACFDPDVSLLLEFNDPERTEAFLVSKFSTSPPNIGVLMESFLFVQYQGRI